MKTSKSLKTLALGTGLNLVKRNFGFVEGLASSNIDISTTLAQPQVVSSPLQQLEELNLCGLGGSDGKDRTDRGTLQCINTSEDLNMESDPTCMACIGGSSLSTAERIWRKYYDPASKQSRLRMFKKHFAQGCSEGDCASEKPVVIVAADDNSLPMLRRWWCHAQRNGLDRDQLIVYTYGLEVSRWAGHHELYTIQPALYGMTISSEVVDESFKYALIPLFLDLLSIGKGVIYNDLNILWASNMGETLSDMASYVDIYGQASETNEGRDLNPSLLSLSANDEVIAFMRSMLSATPLLLESYRSNGDHLVWNNMLRHEQFRYLEWMSLPSPIVVGSDKDEEFVPGETLAIQYIQGSHNGSEFLTDECFHHAMSLPALKTV